MKKKHRDPEPKQSALESARAALEQAGEDPSERRAQDAPPSGTLDNAEASATADGAAAPETVEGAAEGTESTAASDAAEGAAEASDGAEASATADNAAASEAVEGAAEGTESAEASETVENAAASEAVEGAAEGTESAEASATADNAEASETVEDAAETSDGAEASATADNAAASEAVEGAAEASDGAEASKTVETDEAETVVPVSGTVELDAHETTENIPESPVTDDADASEHAETADAPTEEEEAFPEEDEAWEIAEEPDEEFAETEKQTMETREITVGYHRDQTTDKAESGKVSKEKEKKSRFKALDSLKDALRTPGGDDNTPPSGSSRDAAIRKRVMQIEDEETRNYLLDRVLPQMIWYSKKSAQYQTMYYRLMAATILMGALIPVFSVGGSYGVVKVILALLGASVTAVNAYLALHKYQELWISYRSAREDLIHTLYSYFNQAGVFVQKKMSEKEMNVLLVEVCENALSKENGGWTTTILQKS